jgi:hypothetical protein
MRIGLYDEGGEKMYYMQHRDGSLSGSYHAWPLASDAHFN